MRADVLIDQLTNQLETERGHRQADDEESRAEIATLRKLLGELVDLIEAYRSCGSGYSPSALRWGRELDAAIIAAENHIVDAAKIVEPEPGREECLKE